jgi:hypothetical protein
VDPFVKRCRREWKRLRVPDAVANEMAADLDADLREAAADGASPEEVLGSGYFDARSFAASWAAERGVIPAPSAERARGGSPILVATVAFAVVAALGAGMVIASRGPARWAAVAAAPPFQIHRAVIDCPALGPMPPALHTCSVPPRQITAGPPPQLFLRPAQIHVLGSRLDTLGWILLVVGAAGLAVVGVWTLIGRSRAFTPPARRASRIDH